MLKIKISNKGAELNSLTFNGKEMLHDGKKFWNRQAPVLFPMVGRLRDNKTIIDEKEYEIPQHGLAKDMIFDLIEENEYRKVYKTESNEEILKMYPFKFELYTTYEIKDDELIVKYKVVNNEETKTMLFGIRRTSRI